ncbi:LysR family transcriptional regulator [Leeia oryzae]|uniref:LysR family transcriptional regulator n=1 Tax=Leeia oryzae TaxID=356662 RepID=UPI0003768611|nr:LysR family transcriptional regulator [Leeia oryzae]
MRRHLPLNNLQTFEAAARLKSFSRAADELSLTQSAISQQILKLENYVGQALFVRTGSGVELSAAGELLFASVSTSLQGLARGLDRIEPYRDPESVIINLPADVAHGWLIPRLPALRQILPTQEVWLTTTENMREIDRIDVDIVISRRPIHTADVDCTALLEDSDIAVCSPKRAETIGRLGYPSILEKAPLLFHEHDPSWGGLLATGLSPNYRRGYTADDARVLLDAVIQDAGIAYLSSILCAQALQNGQVVRLPQIPGKSRPRLWLIRSRLEPRTPFVNTVFDWLQQVAR